MLTLRRFGGTSVTSSPRSRMRPSSGCSKPAIIRSVVVLPQPDGPSIVKNSPSWISRSTPATAACLPNCLLTLSTVIAVGIRPTLRDSQPPAQLGADAVVAAQELPGERGVVEAQRGRDQHARPLAEDVGDVDAAREARRQREEDDR